MRKKVEKKEAEEAKWNPPSNQLEPMEPAPWVNGNLRVEVDTMPSTGTSGGSPHYSPEARPVLGSPSLSAQAPSSPAPSGQLPAPESTFDRKCEQSQAPVVDRSPKSKLTWGQPHAQRSQLGYSRQGSKKDLKTRLAWKGAAEVKHISAGRDHMDTSGTINGKRERATADGVMDSVAPTRSSGEKCLAGDPQTASVAGKKVVKEHAQ